MASLDFHNVDRLCAKVNLALARPQVDLSAVTFIEPFAMVYLGMFLRYHVNRGKGFEVALPESGKILRYLTDQNFWPRFNFDPEGLPPQCRTPLRTTTSLGNIVDIERRDGIADEVATAVMDLLSTERVSVDLEMVGEIVVELVQNFADHSGRALAAFAAQWFPNRNRLDLVIADCGVGIRASLASNPTYARVARMRHPDVAALAFEPQVTARRGGGGTGLTIVRDYTKRLGAILRLSTCDGYVELGPAASYRGHMAYDLPGVQVEVRIPTSG